MEEGQLYQAAFGREAGRDISASWVKRPLDGWHYLVALGAVGHYAAARAYRSANRINNPALYSLMTSTIASHYRQLGYHSRAAALDGAAIHAVAGCRGEYATIARLDALVGLAADSLGMGRFDAAASLLTEVDDVMVVLTRPEWTGKQRIAIRHSWVCAELAMITGQPLKALSITARIDCASPSIRHNIKTMLIRSAALCSAGHFADAQPLAQRVVRDAFHHRQLPLEWAAASLLAGSGAHGDIDARRDRCADVLARLSGVPPLNLR